MRILLFYHSLISDWNHGNAHFLRGVTTELLERGHKVEVFEPRNAWSVNNLIAEHGEAPLLRFMKAFPYLRSRRYSLQTLPLEDVLKGADLVIVHEWNDPELVHRIGEHRSRNNGYRLLFHDTHHRSQTAPEAMAAYKLEHFDGVLAFGEVIREIYRKRGWAREAWTWHEAADVRVFRPQQEAQKQGDLVWIGNWGDEERTRELHEFLINPASGLSLKSRVYGVRYPPEAKEALADARIEYAGWLPNYLVPKIFSQFSLTVHIPRRPYAEALPGIPTIRPFEALACEIPLVSSPWSDAEGLFEPGKDFLLAKDGVEMSAALNELLTSRSLARELSGHGRQTIMRRHTCKHRVEELMSICRKLGLDC